VRGTTSLKPRAASTARPSYIFALVETRELFISCEKLKNLDTFSKSDPFVIVEMSQR
jgi:hypothetical protein